MVGMASGHPYHLPYSNYCAPRRGARLYNFEGEIMPLSSVMLERLRTAAEQRRERAVDLAQQICAIPAPTGDEGQRAAFVARLWRERGYTPEIDALQNVYVRRGQ